MKIIIICLGTRGDVEPLLALGKALLARGHAVTLCGPDNCEQWVRDEHGVAFAPMGLDFKVLMQSPEVRGARGGGVESAIGKLVGAAMPPPRCARRPAARRRRAWTSWSALALFLAGRTSPRRTAPRS